MHTRLCGAFLLGTLGILTCWSVSQADLVIFKDGYTLQGKIKRDSEYFVDPASNLQMNIPKLGGFFRVDDEARSIVFSPRQVQEVPDRESNRDSDTVRLRSPIVHRTNQKVPPWQVVAVTDWDKKWDRTMTINSPNGRQRVQQHLILLTPKVACIEARDYNWTACYLTRELGPDTVLRLLRQYPEPKKGGISDSEKRFRIFRFLVQAGWYDKAAAELESILNDLPDQKDKAEAARAELKKLLAWQYVDLLEEAHKNGRHHWLQAKLATFPRQGMDEKLIVRVDALRAIYDTVNRQLALAHRYLDDLPTRLTDPAQSKLFNEAVAVIAAGLNPDTVNRLEAFISLAQQAEQEQQRNRTPDQSPEQLLALAVSGWLLGSSSAEAKVETAARLWQSRQFVLGYQRTHGSGSRQKKLADYESKQGVPFDELAQVIRSLPPAEPFELDLLKNGPWAVGGLPLGPAAIYWALFPLQKLLPPTHHALRADVEASIRKGPNYLVQPPPEYHAGRSYPVLFVLHEGGEKPEDMLKRWSFLAAQHGYFLVAPEWARALKSEYEYTAEEHRAVLDVLRDLRQRFQVDSDRVFMFGFGEGAKMAYDVGLSHPDLFAGVLTMGEAPHFFGKTYKQNAQYLPFYVVDGGYDGDTAKDNRQQFEQWVPHGYPALYVQYKGRGREWFDGELPEMFDWMGRKTRAVPFPELGRAGAGPGLGEEFCSMRPTDNHFYWLSGDGMYDRYSNSAQKWNSKSGSAVLQAHSREGNQIHVNTRGFKRVTVWLGQGMIDFEKPVTIYLNSRIDLANRKITPHLGTLLEDFYQRGDRQRLFYAKLEFSP
jgi:predicted esterase